MQKLKHQLQGEAPLIHGQGVGQSVLGGFDHDLTDILSGEVVHVAEGRQEVAAGPLGQEPQLGRADAQVPLASGWQVVNGHDPQRACMLYIAPQTLASCWF